MSDNVVLVTGEVIAANDVGGVKYQRVKLSFGADGAAADVSDANRMPVTGPGASGSTPITGSFTASGRSAPFTARAARGINVTLAGTFGATVSLQRSFDGGTTWSPLTVAGSAWASFTGPVSEIAWEDPEDAVLYSLLCAWTSGTVNYRLSH